jgi:hypothetical protein
MATRRKTSSAGGFSAESQPVEEEKVVEVTEPSTPEELEEEIKAIEEFLTEAVEEVLAEEETKEEPPAPVPAPEVKHENPPPPVGTTLIRHRRNIPRFVRR